MFEKMIADASHAIGLGHRKPYTRRGRKFYAGEEEKSCLG